MALLWPSNTLTLPNFTIPAIPSLTVSSIRTFPECITAARLPCVATTSLSALQSCDQWKCGAIVFDRTGMTFVVVSSPVRVVSGTLISLQIMGGAEVVFGNSATSVLMPGLTLSPLSQLTLTNPTHTSTTRVSTPSTTISNQPPNFKEPSNLNISLSTPPTTDQEASITPKIVGGVVGFFAVLLSVIVAVIYFTTKKGREVGFEVEIGVGGEDDVGKNLKEGPYTGVKGLDGSVAPTVDELNGEKHSQPQSSGDFYTSREPMQVSRNSYTSREPMPSSRNSYTSYPATQSTPAFDPSKPSRLSIGGAVGAFLATGSTQKLTKRVSRTAPTSFTTRDSRLFTDAPISLTHSISTSHLHESSDKKRTSFLRASSVGGNLDSPASSLNPTDFLRYYGFRDTLIPPPLLTSDSTIYPTPSEPPRPPSSAPPRPLLTDIQMTSLSTLLTFSPPQHRPPTSAPPTTHPPISAPSSIHPPISAPSTHPPTSAPPSTRPQSTYFPSRPISLIETPDQESPNSLYTPTSIYTPIDRRNSSPTSTPTWNSTRLHTPTVTSPSTHPLRGYPSLLIPSLHPLRSNESLNSQPTLESVPSSLRPSSSNLRLDNLSSSNLRQDSSLRPSSSNLRLDNLSTSNLRLDSGRNHSSSNLSTSNLRLDSSRNHSSSSLRLDHLSTSNLRLDSNHNFTSSNLRQDSTLYSPTPPRLDLRTFSTDFNSSPSSFRPAPSHLLTSLTNGTDSIFSPSPYLLADAISFVSGGEEDGTIERSRSGIGEAGLASGMESPYQRAEAGLGRSKSGVTERGFWEEDKRKG